MKLKDKIRTRGAAFSYDLIVVPIAWFGAYWLRFNLESIPEAMFLSALKVFPAVVIIQGVVFGTLVCTGEFGVLLQCRI